MPPSSARTEQCPHCGQMFTRVSVAPHGEACGRVKVLVDRGLNDYEIAERLGVSPERVGIHRHRITGRRGSGRAHRGNNAPAEATIQKIKSLAAEGWPHKEIALTLGISRSSAAYWAGKNDNGRQWLAVQRWARKRHPDLFTEITEG